MSMPLGVGPMQHFYAYTGWSHHYGQESAVQGENKNALLNCESTGVFSSEKSIKNISNVQEKSKKYFSARAPGKRQNNHSRPSCYYADLRTGENTQEVQVLPRRDVDVHLVSGQQHAANHALQVSPQFRGLPYQKARLPDCIRNGIPIQLCLFAANGMSLKKV